MLIQPGCLMSSECKSSPCLQSSVHSVSTPLFRNLPNWRFGQISCHSFKAVDKKKKKKNEQINMHPLVAKPSICYPDLLVNWCVHNSWLPQVATQSCWGKEREEAGEIGERRAVWRNSTYVSHPAPSLSQYPTPS